MTIGDQFTKEIELCSCNKIPQKLFRLNSHNYAAVKNTYAKATETNLTSELKNPHNIRMQLEEELFELKQHTTMAKKNVKCILAINLPDT